MSGSRVTDLVSGGAIALPATLHASAVVIGETGVIVRGASGTGKSALARALVGAARARGLHANLIGDDRVRLKAAAGRLLAAPHPAIAGKIEARGRGILEFGHEPAAVIHLDAVLVENRDELPRMPEKVSTISWFGEIGIAGLRFYARRASADLAAEILEVCSTSWQR